MLARNPKTGKDLRIINLDTSVWRDQKTLVWFGDVPEKAEWNRWDLGATDTAVADKLHAAGIFPDVVLCLNDPTDVTAWLEAGSWSKARIVAVSKDLITSLGMKKLLELKMTNLLCIDEIHDLYPFTGAAWDGTKEDAKALIALALHFGRSFPVTASEERTAFATKRGLKLLQTVEKPQELWLVTQFYDPGKGKRRVEIEECLKKNLECSAVDRVILLNEKPMGQVHGKIQEKVIGKRLTYADVIRWIYDEAPENVIVAFANADIFLDGDSWRVLWSTDLITKPKFLALLRWDVQGVSAADIEKAKLFGPRADSQDTWVVSAKAIKSVTWDWAALNFPFGQGGCDNAITLEMFKQRFLIANPSLSLRTYHYHSSEVRTYDPRDIVDKPSYLYIQPTGLHDMRPVMDWGKPAKELVRKPVECQVKGPLSVPQAKTFCTMVKRTSDDQIVLHPMEKTVSQVANTKLYEFNEVFQTREGLFYTYDSIYVGKTKASTNAWADSQISSMAASLAIDEAVIAPLPDAVAKDASKFILKYMSKIFVMRDEFNMPKGEFWCPKNKGCIEAIKMFNWPAKEIPVLSRDENQQTWCKKAVVWPYEDVIDEIVSVEEVAALRKNLGLGGWKESPERRLVFMVDDVWITEAMVDTIEDTLQGLGINVRILWPGRTSLDLCLQTMIGAWGVVLASKELLCWSWVLPTGAYVWEIQSEMEPSATLLHLCAAAELDHRLLIVAKGVPNQREKDAVFAKLITDMKGFLEVKEITVTVATPDLILPAKCDGFFGHAGDSFREMAKIWGERGYVNLKEKPVEQVWLGAVGDTLLYDRPTLEWLQRSSEKTWKKALFGNPAPKDGKAWSFWPRRPALVEELVEKGLPTKSFEAREKTLVFYGRSENAVQRKRRTGCDWFTACDDFSHRISNVDEYVYTQKEYLERLANAKYGLCLAGYGNKCHREIECMAMGCVPVVAPEVDMSSYADPPVEGLHYFRVQNPEEAKQVTQVTPDRWTVMSAACRDWWLRNASAEGMWRLTQKL